MHVKNWKKVKKAGRKKGKEGANKKLVIYKRRQFGNWGNKKKKKKKASPNANSRQTRLHDGGNETCTCINMKEDMERKPDHEILTLSQCEM